MIFTVHKLVKIFLLCSYIFLSCPMLLESAPPPIHIRCANRLTNTILPILQKELNLFCDGEGGSMHSNIVSSIYLSFYTERRASIEEARELLVRATEKFAKAINADENIRPYLAEYPFPPSRVQLSISFEVSGKDEYYADGTVSSISQVHNTIYYYTKEPLRSPKNHDPFLTEPYPDALKIVQSSKLTNAEVCIHTPKPYEAELDQFIASLSKKIKKKWGVVGVSMGGNMREGIEDFAFLLQRYKRVKLEEARRLEVEITEMLVEQINGNEKLRPYMKHYPYTPSQVRVKIEFQPDPYFGFTDGSLCSVSQENNKLQYYVSHVEKGNGWLLGPFFLSEEPYDEAQRLILQKPKSSFLRRWME